MQYKINEFAKLAAISTRTLRYYDQIDLLKPMITKSSGYRYYGPDEIDRLEQIMYLRTLDVPLKSIKTMLDDADSNHLDMLKSHLHQLNQKRTQLNSLINMLKQSIDAKEKNEAMKDLDKFKGFKKSLIEENAKLYRTEVETKWSNDAYMRSKKAFSNMSKDDYTHFRDLENKILLGLKIAYNEKLKLNAPEMRKIAKMHQEWITMAWGTYNEDAHFQLVDLYVQDDRFKSYYDKYQDGLAQLLRDAVQAYLTK